MGWGDMIGRAKADLQVGYKPRLGTNTGRVQVHKILCGSLHSRRQKVPSSRIYYFTRGCPRASFPIFPAFAKIYRN